MKKFSLFVLCSLFAIASYAARTSAIATATVTPVSLCTGTSVELFALTNTQGSNATTTTAFNFVTTGTYAAADISSFSLYRNTTNTLTGATFVGSVTPSTGAGAQTITYSTLTMTASATRYYILVANIATGATAGNTIAVNAITSAAGTPFTYSGTLPTYSGTAGASGTFTIGVTPAPITSASSYTVCAGNVIVLNDATGTGTWASSNTALASVDGSGNLTAINGGNPVITFTSGICSASVTLTVGAAVTAISSPTAICTGSTTTFTIIPTASTGTGTWSSSDNTTASITTGGVARGVAPGGPVTISYTTPGCAAVTAPLTVNIQPSAITGGTYVCPAAATSLTATPSGGTWTSSVTAVATIDPALGTAQFASAGTTTISYTLSDGCQSTLAFTGVQTPGPISGPTSVCATTLLAQNFNSGLTGQVGGTWNIVNVGSSTYDWAIVAPTGYADEGIGGDGSNYITTDADEAGSGVTLNTQLISPSFSTVGYSALTVGVDNFYDYYSSDVNAEIDYSTDGGTTWNVVYNYRAGAANSGATTWSATTPNQTIALPAGAMGKPSVMLRWYYNSVFGNWWAVDNITVTAPSTPITLIDPVSGGTWTSSATSVAGVTTGGVVSGVSAGTTTISYANVCGIVTQTVTSFGTPGITTGLAATDTFCYASGTTFALSNPTAGGTWTSSLTSVLTVDPVSGLVAEIGGTGTTVISYSTGCNLAATETVTVNNPGVISGPTSVCGGSNITLTTTGNGGTWTSSDPSATITTGGVLSGVYGGNTVVSYTAGNCIATYSVTINAPSLISGTGGTVNVCGTGTNLLSSSPGGGTWSSSDNTIASIDPSSGLLQGVNPSVTPVTISYTQGGCAAVATIYDGIPPAPIGGLLSACPGSTSLLTDASGGGVWSSGTTANASVDVSGNVMAIISGTTAVISYTTPGCAAATATFTVNPVPPAIGGVVAIGVGLNTFFTDALAGGTWSSGGAGVATVDPATGSVYGVAVGTAPITYTSALGCITTTTATVVSAASVVYTPFVLSGFNTDIIAEGAGNPTSPTGTTNSSLVENNLGFDGGNNYSFLSANYTYGSPVTSTNCVTGATQLYALPASGHFYSYGNANLPYQLANYTGNNALLINAGTLSAAYSGTLTVGSPIAADTLYVLGVSATPTSSASVTVTFTDGTTQTFPLKNLLHNWFDCTGAGTYAPADKPEIACVGRVNTTTGVVQTGTTGPELYKDSLVISTANQGKLVQSLTFNVAHVTGSTYSTLGVFAVTARSGILQTSVNNISFASTLIGCSSASTALTINGVGLLPVSTGSVIATAPAGFQVSADGSTWGSTAVYPISATGAIASSLYVRFSPTSPSVTSGVVTFSGGGGIMSLPSIAVSGTTSGLYYSPSTVAAFGPVTDGSTSSAITYSVSGTGLTPGTVTVTSSNPDFQVSSDGSTWGTSANFTTTTTLSATLYVEYIPVGVGAETSTLTFSGTATSCLLPITATGTGSNPCTNPTAPTGITFSGTSVTGTSVSFTPSGTVDGYLLVQGTTPFTGSPVATTTYTVGSALGSGTVVGVYSSSVTMPVTSLAGNTLYYFTVIPFKGGATGACSGGPLYPVGTQTTNTVITCVATPAFATNTVTLSSITLNWGSVAGGNASAVTYTVVVSSTSDYATPVGASPYIISDPTTTVTVPGLTSGATYYYEIMASSPAAPCTPVFNTGSIAAGSLCTPTFSGGTGSCSGYYTNNVVFNGTTWTGSSATCGTSNYLSQVFTVTAGVAAPISITSSNYTGSAAWVDFHNTGAFNDPGDGIFLPGYSGAAVATYSGSVTIPSTVPTGTYRMRVITNWATAWSSWVPGAAQGPCSAYSTSGYGDFQDFTLYVINPTITSTASSLSSFGTTPTCSSSAVQTFSITGTGLVPAAGNIVANAPAGGFQVSADGTTWGTTATYPYTAGALAASTVYVRFSPTATGTPSGGITFTGALTTPTVSVTGSATGMTIAPATTAVFGPINVGTSSAAQVYTLTGTGLTPGTVTVTSSNPDFQVSPTGLAGSWVTTYNFTNTSVIPGADASVYVQYSPTATVTESSVITISGTSPGCTLTYSATGTGSNPCAAPLAPTAISTSGTTASGTTVNFTASGTPDGYIVLEGTTPFTGGTPVTGTTYTVGSILGTGTVVAVYTGTTPPLAITSSVSAPINSNTAYNITVIPFNGGLTGTCAGGPLYATAYLATTYTTCPAVPASVTTSSVTGASFAVNWTPVPGGGTDAITYNIDVTTDPTFATGITTYPASTSPYTVTGLSGTTNYYYRVSAVTAACTSAYTSTVSVTTSCGITPLPYLETFESITAANTLPSCMAATNLGSYTYTYTGPTGVYNQASYTGGTKFASFHWSCNDYFFTPAFNFVAGNTYQVSFEYVTDGFGGWNTLKAAYGTSQTAAAMTTNVGTPLSGPTNTTYQLYSGVFTPTATGTYYVGVYCTANSVPWYLTIDNIAVQQLPSIVASSNPVSFGNIPTCAPATQSFTVTGNGLLPATGSGTITATAPTGYQVSSNGVSYGSTANYTYSAGVLSASTVYVKYTPTVTGAFSSNIVFTGGSVSPAYSVAVSGTATGMAIAPATTAAFGPISVSATSPAITYTVTGSGLTAGTVTVSSSNPDFQVSPTGLAGSWATTYNFSNTATLSANVYVQYTPTTVGTESSTITISGTSPGCALTFTATGTGANPCSTPPSAPTAMTFPATSSTGSTVNFTPVGTPDGYMLVSGTVAYTGTVTAGTTYTAGSSVGSGTVLGYYVYTSTPTYSFTGLTGNTEYYVTAIPFNGGSLGTCSGGPLYGPVLTNTVITCPVAPASITTSGIGSTGFTMTWPSSSGGGATAVTYIINVTTDAGFTASISGFPVTVADAGGTNNYTVAGAPSGATLYYSITAVGACNSAATTGNVTTTANYNYIALSGFNMDVIANGSGPAAGSVNTTALGTSGFDGAGWAFVASNYVDGTNVPLSGTEGSGSTIQPYSLPLSGILSSLLTPGLSYHLANYSGNNALVIANASSTLTGTLTCATPQYASQLYVIGCTGSASSTTPNVTFTLHFTDGTTQVAPVATTFGDWYGGASVAAGSVGRVNVTSNACDGTSTGPNFYQYTFSVTPANYGKQIASVTTSVASGAAGYLGLFAISERDGIVSSTTGDMDFSSVGVCSVSPVQSTSISAGTLYPATGTLTVTATPGFKIATSAAGPFVSTLSFPYTGNALPATALYVEFTPTVIGAAAGTLTFTGGTVNANSSINLTGNGIGGAISGGATICPAGIVGLSESVAGGTWSTSAPSVATVSTSGVVTGISGGTATISYTFTNSCGTEYDSVVLTVNPAPNAGAITGTPSVCSGLTTSLTDATGSSAGTWSSTAPAFATVDASGNVNGLIAGTTTISYAVTNSCGTAAATQTFTVNPLPDAGTISGASTVCAASSTPLTDVATGGTWSSTATSFATLDASGNVTGIAAGTTTISYTVTNGCGTAAATQTFTVNPLPDAGSISGASSVCVGSATGLTDGATGGTWSSTAPAFATVDASGNVNGLIAGTTTISYAVTNSCGTAAATQTFTVNPLPDAGTISGASTVCAGSSTPLTDGATGGTWSSTATAFATVDASGNVTGIAAGTTTISYTVTNGCGTAAATQAFTVNPLPDAGTISGASSECVGSTTGLTEGATGGTWSSTAPAFATVDASGNVNGLSAGTTTISYTVTNGCGTAAATQTFTVSPLPDAGTISGASTVCAASSTPLTDGATGGTWSSTATTFATVDASGNVTGIAAGTTTISYTVTNGCGTAAATQTFTVSPLPVAGTISGASSVCAGSSTPLTDGATGGTWSSTAPSFATVDASGNVNGLSAGTTTISYTVTNGCGTIAATQSFTVNPLPVAGTISGASTVCAGSSTPLTDGATGGTWSSTATAFATVDASGNITGIAAGTTTISYTVTNGCGTVAATQTFTVNPLPDAGSITGASTVCAGSSTPLTDGAAGGTWSSTSPAFATVDASGNVNGLSAGTTTISYTATNGCGTIAATQSFTVNPLPVAGTISGASTVCAGSSTPLTDGATGGTWSSTAAAFATVDASGNVAGIAAGTTTISYIVTNGCGTIAATSTMTVNPLPDPGTITGSAATVCVGTTLPLTDGATGGTWSSTDPSFATVDASGNVTGIATGATTISYTASNGCGTLAATYAVAVNAIPDAGSISGATAVCAGSSTPLADGATGGTWSSTATSFATVDASGNVTGIAAGTTTISYTATNLCGTTAATYTMTVNPLPDAGAITGTVTAVCAGSATTLTESATGGTWSSTATSYATVDASGLVSGIAAGTTVISYTASNGCGTVAATYTVAVNPLPDAGIITGTVTAVCMDAVTTLTESATGGTWSSTATAFATVDASGNVTGIAAGTATISYTVTNICGTAAATYTVTVNPLADTGSITGTTAVCAGATTPLADGGATGGTWSSAATSFATVDPLSGVVTGITAGTAVISYAVTNGCGTLAAVTTVTVNPLPDAGVITGTVSVCVGSVTTLSDVATGGSWISTNTAFATVDASGNVNGITAGTTEISYTVTNGCGTAADSVAVTVNPLPLSYTLTGGGAYCATDTGVHIGLSGSDAGVNYQLYDGSSAVGAVVAGTGSALDFGLFTSAGTYTVQATSTAGCNSDMAGTATVTVTSVVTPTVVITAVPGTTVVEGQNDTLTANVTGGGASPTYQWQLNGVNITGATSATYIDSFANNDSLTCIVTNTDACASDSSGSITIHVTPVGVKQVLNGTAEVTVMPNPNKGFFSVTGTWPIIDGTVQLEIVDMLGQVVYKDNVVVQNGKINTSIRLSNTLSNGMYILNLRTDDAYKMFHFIIEQ